MKPRLSLRRLNDAHCAWLGDLTRVDDHEKALDGLDHLKQCGHLAYWLRRSAPVIDYIDMTTSGAIAEDGDLYADEAEVREFLDSYGNEYLAFDFGLQICSYYEMHRTDGHARAAAPALTRAYLKDVCHLLKFKNVSPHALYMVYKSLFTVR